eukprot:6461342-Amphidinium_carterae.1
MPGDSMHSDWHSNELGALSPAQLARPPATSAARPWHTMELPMSRFALSMLPSRCACPMAPKLCHLHQA